MSKGETRRAAPWPARRSIMIAAATAVAIGAFLSTPVRADESAAKSNWKNLPTDDASLWEPCNFGGDGDVKLGKEAISLGMGDPLTGVRCLAELPRENFEIELESRRLTNFDFFCGLTFPVGKGQCSFIVGGWAGAVVGLSNVDGHDASENPTKRLMSFDNGRWYRVRVRVDEERVRTWIDDKLIVDQLRDGHEFDIRAEMHPSLPVGIAAYQCEAELRNVRWRPLEEAK